MSLSGITSTDVQAAAASNTTVIVHRRTRVVARMGILRLIIANEAAKKSNLDSLQVKKPSIWMLGFE